MHKLPLGEICRKYKNHPQWNASQVAAEGTVTAFTKYLSMWDKQNNSLVKSRWKKDTGVNVLNCIRREISYCVCESWRWHSLSKLTEMLWCLHYYLISWHLTKQIYQSKNMVTLLMNRLLWLKLKRKDPSLAQRLPPWTAKFPAWLLNSSLPILGKKTTEYTRQKIQICLLHHSTQVCYWLRGSDLPPRTHFWYSCIREQTVTL